MIHFATQASPPILPVSLPHQDMATYETKPASSTDIIETAYFYWVFPYPNAQDRPNSARKTVSRSEAVRAAKRIRNQLAGRKFEDSTKVIRDIRNK